MRSAPTLNIWMTPFSSVAMLEKLALLKIALCKAPAFSRASLRRTSVTTLSLLAAGMGEPPVCADMSAPPSSLLTGVPSRIRCNPSVDSRPFIGEQQNDRQPKCQLLLLTYPGFPCDPPHPTS